MAAIADDCLTCFATTKMPTGVTGMSPLAVANVGHARLVALAAPKTGAINVLLLIVTALVLNTNSSTTLAKSGIVKVVAPVVWLVSAIVTNCPLVSSRGLAADVARLV